MKKENDSSTIQKKKSTKTMLISYIILIFLIGVILGSVTTFLIIQQIDYNNNTSLSLNDTQELPGPVGAEIRVIAVTEDGDGIIGTANVEIIQGRGRMLVNTNPFIEPDTQQSAETAILVAKEITGKKLDKYDIVVSFNMTLDTTNNESQILGGPSAGAAITLAMISAIESKSLKNNIAITGSIERNGTIGSVGSVFEKAQAAGKHGIEIFFIPKGLGSIIAYEKNITENQDGNFKVTKVSYLPSKINIGDFTMEEYNMSVVEVDTINDLLQYVFIE
ncbi:MAG: S16 family serine protease [Candidatus Aenigmatarchaeota archaeon]